MKNLTKPKIRIVRKHRGTEVLRCGARVSVITFPERKDGKIRGEVTYKGDWGVPQLQEVSTVMQGDGDEIQ